MSGRIVVAHRKASEDAGSSAELALECSFISEAVALTGLDEVFVDTPDQGEIPVSAELVAQNWEELDWLVPTYERRLRDAGFAVEWGDEISYTIYEQDSR